MIRQIVLALIVVMAAIGGASMGVAAQSDDDGSFFDGLLDDDDDGGLLKSAGVWIAGATSGISRTVAAYTGDKKSASTYAEDFEAQFNDHNESLETFANERLTADTDHDVFVLNFTDREDGSASIYVVSDVENGSWTNARALNQSEFSATNRTADQWVELDWYQSREAAAELEAFVDEYAEPNEDLSTSYRATTLAKYGAPDSSMWNTTEEN